MTAILPLPAGGGQHDAVFTPVAGASPLVRIVGALARTSEVVVAAAPRQVDGVREVLAGMEFSAIRVVAADPSGTRRQCIAAGLLTAPEGPVLLHDPAWPLIADVTLDAVVSAVRGGATTALPVRPVTDSVKAIDAHGSVTATLDRSLLRTVQYPRGFDRAMLVRLLAAEAGEPFDELSAALAADVALTLVDGDTDTMRFDLPAEAAFLAAVIEGRQDVPHRPEGDVRRRHHGRR